MYPLTKAVLAGLFSFAAANYLIRNDVQVVSDLRGSVGNEELVLLAHHKRLPIEDRLLGGVRLKYLQPEEREGYEGIYSAYGYVNSNPVFLGKFYVDTLDGKVSMQFVGSDDQTEFKVATLPSRNFPR